MSLTLIIPPVRRKSSRTREGETFSLVVATNKMPPSYKSCIVSGSNLRRLFRSIDFTSLYDVSQQILSSLRAGHFYDSQERFARKSLDQQQGHAVIPLFHTHLRVYTHAVSSWVCSMSRCLLHGKFLTFVCI